MIIIIKAWIWIECLGSSFCWATSSKREVELPTATISASRLRKSSERNCLASRSNVWVHIWFIWGSCKQKYDQGIKLLTVWSHNFISCAWQLVFSLFCILYMYNRRVVIAELYQSIFKLITALWNHPSPKVSSQLVRQKQRHPDQNRSANRHQQTNRLRKHQHQWTVHQHRPEDWWHQGDPPSKTTQQSSVQCGKQHDGKQNISSQEGSATPEEEDGSKRNEPLKN